MACWKGFWGPSSGTLTILGLRRRGIDLARNALSQSLRDFSLLPTMSSCWTCSLTWRLGIHLQSFRCIWTTLLASVTQQQLNLVTQCENFKRWPALRIKPLNCLKNQQPRPTAIQHLLWRTQRDRQGGQARCWRSWSSICWLTSIIPWDIIHMQFVSLEWLTVIQHRWYDFP